MRVKEETEKSGLKVNIQKIKIMASAPITLWQTDGEMVETVADFNFVDAFIIPSDFGTQGNKISQFPLFFPSISHEVIGLDAMILVLKC